MAPGQQHSDKAPPKEFNKHLFETGLFSDVTLIYMQKHTIKLHSSVLKSKSTWFAEHCIGKTLICDGILVASESKVFGTSHKSCKHHSDDADCKIWNRFVDMLSFCYTGEYLVPMSTSQDLNTADTRLSCGLHIYMYILGKRYGVQDMLPLAAEGFATNAEKLLSESPDSLIDHINIIYDALASDHDDALVEARRTTERLADNMQDMIPIEVLLEAKKNYIKENMPKAGVELLERGYKPKATSSGPMPAARTVHSEGLINDKEICFRCRIATPVKDTRLCQKCMDMPVLGSTLTFAPKSQEKTGELWGPPLAGKRYTFQAGMTCTFWACIGCHRIWQGQGLRQSDIEMKECSACDPEDRYSYPRDRYWVRRIHWKCGRCLTVWVAHAFERKKMDDMDKCVCCPNE